MAEFNGEYVAAVCRSAEKNLISEERFDKLSSMTYADAVKVLKEYGYDADGTGTFESAILSGEKCLFDFIRRYSPSENVTAYEFCDNDYFNAETALREKMLGLKSGVVYVTEGKYAVSEFSAYLDGEKCSLDERMKKTLDLGKKLFLSGKATGVSVNVLFARAKFSAKLAFAGKNQLLCDFVITEIDYANLTGALRSGDTDYVKNNYIDGGTVSLKQLISLCQSVDSGVSSLKSQKYGKIVAKAVADRKDGVAMVDFERFFNGYTLCELKKDRYTSQGVKAFLLYCEYKKNELKNVRTLTVGLNGGLDKKEIKARMRENYAG